MVAKDYCFINFSSIIYIEKWHRDSDGYDWRGNTVITFAFIDGSKKDFTFYDREDDEELEKTLKELEALFNDSRIIKIETR